MSKTAYQKQKRDQEFHSMMSGWFDFTDGWYNHDTIRLEWKKSSYMLYFDFNGRERHVNIIDQCRKYCGRLTADVRRKIEESIPSTIKIYTECVPFYAQGCAYNIGGYRYLHSVSSKSMESWLQNL